MSLKLINGKLQIPSGRQSRTTIYNTDGTLEDIVTYNMARSGSFVASALIAQNGTLIIQRMLENRGVQFVEQSQGFSTMTPEGDTLAIISTPYIRTMERTERGDIPLRFGPLPRVTFAPNRGIYLTTGLPPEIDWYNLDGRLIRKIKILFVSQSVSVADREKVKDYFNDQISEAGAQVQSEFSGQLSAEFLESQRDNSRFAELKAHWMNIQVDDNGYIWLQKYETAGAYTFSTQIREYYVLSPEGEFLGSTSIPEVDFATFGDRYVLASITEQTTGEMIPTLFRIMSNAAGFKYP